MTATVSTIADRKNQALSNNAPSILVKLYDIMEEKQTNLCVAADVTTSADLVRLVHQVGPYICVLKTHIDIISDFTPELIQELTKLAEMYHFLLFEDRKFADIGSTVVQQYTGGIYKISSWSHLTNCHTLPGPGILAALSQICVERTQNDRGILILTDMSSEGWLGDDEYRRVSLAIGLQYKHCVVGWISQSRWDPSLSGVVMTPGISLHHKSDALGQNYSTPMQAITERGSDIIIVGRSIVQATNPASAAEVYRQAGWDAYLSTISEQ